ncbi:two-component system response regulator [Bacillus sp. FJAT-27264]|uniref:response regulator transcription factor n=1 Tax=Paenibacillus sp. (strain DSM 101736 / FJAT-27264) TaxID=1850362 RepID=UPI0008080677|nr:response regulator transcription factor [Bacillus sp. FJAT-27264]OBZ18138.1 two-component system response regulator [Bacillus sp. FJAT-27264]
MKEYNLLIIEDDHKIGSLLEKILQREGYKVYWRTDGKDMLEIIKHIDLVIMDVMLPDEDGYLLTRKLKNRGLPIPVIFLSARGDMDSKLQGLEIGDEYMVKPFDPRELLLRIRKMLDNTYGTFVQILHLYIDVERKRVFNSSLHQEVLFTATERKLFFYLYENRGRILSKEHFLEYAWQLEDRNPNLIPVHIKKVRAKIQDELGEIIETIYGEGYRLNTYFKS